MYTHDEFVDEIKAERDRALADLETARADAENYKRQAQRAHFRAQDARIHAAELWEALDETLPRKHSLRSAGMLLDRLRSRYGPPPGDRERDWLPSEDLPKFYGLDHPPDDDEFLVPQGEDCDECKGTGEITDNPGWPDPQTERTWRCNACGGSGARK